MCCGIADGVGMAMVVWGWRPGRRGLCLVGLEDVSALVVLVA